MTVLSYNSYFTYFKKPRETENEIFVKNFSIPGKHSYFSYV